MAGKSKSSEKKENSKDKEEVDASEVSGEAAASNPESSSEDPVVIEGEATEVDADAEDLHTADEGTASDESEASTEDAPEGSDETSGDVASTEETATDVEAPAAATAQPPQTEQQSAGSGVPVLAMVFGGIVAGAIGYFGSALAPKPEPAPFDESELTAGIAANTAALGDLEGSLAALQEVSAPEVDLSGLESQIGTIMQSLDTLTRELTTLQTGLSETTAAFEAQANELDERVVALETAVPQAGELATDDELRALRTRIEEMMGEAEARLAEAQAEADAIAQEATEMRAAAEAEALEVAAAAEAREAELQALGERQSALLDLKSAMEAGTGYAETLPALGAVPDVISANAESGIPTIKSLQESFPTVARTALSQSVTVAEDASVGERLTAFINRRTNARSLTEQEGDSPDAVLSRAEARLGEGDLAAAVAELDSLPEAGKAALEDWLEQARTRLTAVEAVDELTATN
ncbi:MAG: mitofilin family membrane protein [Paracoccaceae bacterium]|nr:mitofilin family membrane protein [Paracoccaceae bacterium]